MVEGPARAEAETSILISCLEPMPAHLSVDLAASAEGEDAAARVSDVLHALPRPAFNTAESSGEETRLQGKLKKQRGSHQVIGPQDFNK